MRKINKQKKRTQIKEEIQMKCVKSARERTKEDEVKVEWRRRETFERLFCII